MFYQKFRKSVILVWIGKIERLCFDSQQENWYRLNTIQQTGLIFFNNNKIYEISYENLIIQMDYIWIKTGRKNNFK